MKLQLIPYFSNAKWLVISVKMLVVFKTGWVTFLCLVHSGL